MAAIRPKDLPPGIPSDTAAIIFDSGISVEKATPLDVVNAGRPLASQAEAEGGTENTKIMSSLRVAQAIVQQVTNVKAQASAIGIGATDTNMGTYTGTTIPDNQTAKQNIQALETALEKVIASTSVTCVATEDISPNREVNIYSNAGVRSIRNAIATGFDKAAHGYILAGVSSGGSAVVYSSGLNPDSAIGFDGDAFLSATTPGTPTATPLDPNDPANAGKISQHLGTAISGVGLVFSYSPPIGL